MNTIPSVAISAFPAMSDVMETTPENVSLNVIAVTITTSIAATILTITQLVLSTTPQEMERLYTAMTGAAQKIIPTVRVTVFQMPLTCLMVMVPLQTHTTTMMNQFTIQRSAVEDRDVVMLGKPTSSTSPPTPHSVASWTQL